VHRDAGRSRVAPEEGGQLLSAAGGPGQVHAVVAAVSGHHEAARPAGIPHTVVVHPETGEKERQIQFVFPTGAGHAGNC